MEGTPSSSSNSNSTSNSTSISSLSSLPPINPLDVQRKSKSRGSATESSETSPSSPSVSSGFAHRLVIPSDASAGSSSPSSLSSAAAGSLTGSGSSIIPSSSSEAMASAGQNNRTGTFSETGRASTRGGKFASPGLKPKRKRITPEQFEVLTGLFEKTDTPSFEIRESVSHRLGMTNREVQVWFQNRRAKMNRLKQAAQGQASQQKFEQPSPQSEANEGNRTSQTSNFPHASQFTFQQIVPQASQPAAFEPRRPSSTSSLPSGFSAIPLQSSPQFMFGTESPNNPARPPYERTTSSSRSITSSYRPSPPPPTPASVASPTSSSSRLPYSTGFSGIEIGYFERATRLDNEPRPQIVKGSSGWHPPQLSPAGLSRSSQSSVFTPFASREHSSSLPTYFDPTLTIQRRSSSSTSRKRGRPNSPLVPTFGQDRGRTLGSPSTTPHNSPPSSLSPIRTVFPSNQTAPLTLEQHAALIPTRHAGRDPLRLPSLKDLFPPEQWDISQREYNAVRQQDKDPIGGWVMSAPASVHGARANYPFDEPSDDDEIDLRHKTPRLQDVPEDDGAYPSCSNFPPSEQDSRTPMNAAQALPMLRTRSRSWDERHFPRQLDVGERERRNSSNESQDVLSRSYTLSSIDAHPHSAPGLSPTLPIKRTQLDRF